MLNFLKENSVFIIVSMPIIILVINIIKDVLKGKLVITKKSIKEYIMLLVTSYVIACVLIFLFSNIILNN